MTDTENEEMPVMGTRTHPHVTKLVMDPATWAEFERRCWDRPEVKVRRLDDVVPDQWVVWVACASETVKDLLEEHW